MLLSVCCLMSLSCRSTDEVVPPRSSNAAPGGFRLPVGARYWGWCAGATFVWDNGANCSVCEKAGSAIKLATRALKPAMKRLDMIMSFPSVNRISKTIMREARTVQMGASKDGFGIPKSCARMRVRGSDGQSDPHSVVVESSTASAPPAVVSLHHRHILNPIRSAYEPASMPHLGGEAAPS